MTAKAKAPPPPYRGRIPEGPFDPEAWLAQAEEYGVDAYQWWGLPKGGKGGKRGWCWMEDIADEKYDQEIDLWGWLRPDTETGEANAVALYAYMDETCRFGPREWREKLESCDLETKRYMRDERRKTMLAQLGEIA